MTAMLASVSNLDEALQVLAVNVGIIDLKQPSQGALGALSLDTVSTIVTAINGQCPLSATIGDLPMHPEVVASAVKRMAATGVDYIKIGFFPGDDWPGTLEVLAEPAASGLALIAVLFADCQPDFTVLGTLKQAGFKGVMIDTQDKQKGALTQILPQADIKAFVEKAARYQLLCGLAGSLRLEDIAQLISLQPDYLGFRGALCRQHDRTAQLDEHALRAVKARMMQ
ncbi:MAG: hypothetical protein CVV13_07450 [Gammaproteobacteria bacterium HGW-Gammaproteobacteria-3]|nr:MAG: hypothetical protein CVV13_07450 [Gammaproteobacteria bacterium HGW-Gammaproteobacteria-3]